MSLINLTDSNGGQRSRPQSGPAVAHSAALYPLSDSSSSTSSSMTSAASKSTQRTGTSKGPPRSQRALTVLQNTSANMQPPRTSVPAFRPSSNNGNSGPRPTHSINGSISSTRSGNSANRTGSIADSDIHRGNQSAQGSNPGGDRRLPPRYTSGGFKLGVVRSKGPSYSSDVGILKCNKIPNGTTQRIFRKKIGCHIKACFNDPPRFTAYLKINKGVPESGTIIFPNVTCSERFFRQYGPQARQNIEISKQPLRFERAKPQDIHVSRQEVAALRFEGRKPTFDAMSDYEYDDEEKCLDVFVHHVEMGVWDAEGKYASAWQSKELSDYYSTIDIDGDSAIVSIRIGDDLLRMSLYHLQNIVVDNKDIYLESSVLPIYLADNSGGFEALKRQVGVMALQGLSAPSKFLRIPAFDEEHERVAPWCYVTKVRCLNPDAIEKLLARFKHKIMPITDYMTIGNNVEMPFRGVFFRRLRDWYPNLSFELAFQVESIALHGMLTPAEVLTLQPVVDRLDQELSPKKAAALFYEVRQELDWRAPGQKVSVGVEELKKRLLEQLHVALNGGMSYLEEANEDGFFLIPAAVISPAGISLEGPNRDAGNRIVRQFPGNENRFLRVRLQEQTGDIIRHMRDVDQDSAIFSGKIKTIFEQGLRIGGRHFTFLAFSNSSLRDHSTWFVSDFLQRGTRVTAHSIRDGIGNLSAIRIPARYAARLGQAFTSTPFSIPISSDRQTRVSDILRNQYNFSDGCGQLSPDVMRRLHEADPRRRRRRKMMALPSVFQVRIGGAKGVLSLNPELPPGVDVVLRPSMIKFEVNPENMRHLTLDVASSADAPMKTFLNRPLIALLETLGVAPENFIKIQEIAIAELRLAVTDMRAAISMYHASSLGQAGETADLLQTLSRVLDVKGTTDVAFLKRCNLTCLTGALRQIKYKARCRVDKAWTLMGVIDETGWLKEGEIYAQIKEGQEATPYYLKGFCLVGRSPYMAPGDVQWAHLIGEPPLGSPLRQLHNCLVFSQHGRRPLCNQLAGGDLDGDTFNIFMNELLYPNRTAKPADYAPPVPAQLNRPCNIKDVIDFFLTYCQTDTLGMISDRHLSISDRSDKGVEDPDCVTLARLGSLAVDYQKTGVPPPPHAIPRLPDNVKPDYFQSEHRIENQQHDRRSRFRREDKQYYRSDKALGQLFRRIDVTADIDAWGRKAPPSMSEAEVRRRYWAKIRPQLTHDWLDGGLEADLGQVQSYYQQVKKIGNDYAPERRMDPLSEEEIYMGVILTRFSGRYGVRQRMFDAQVGLRDDFGELIDSVMSYKCDSEDWNTPLITWNRMSEIRENTLGKGSEAKFNAFHSVRDESQRILGCLARWIRAAEMFEDSQERISLNDGASSRNHHSRKAQVQVYASAKWIAMAAALKKVEELELWEDYVENTLPIYNYAFGTDDEEEVEDSESEGQNNGDGDESDDSDWPGEVQRAR